MSKCWGNIDSLKKNTYQSLPLLLLQKTLILIELPYYYQKWEGGFQKHLNRWGIMVKASKKMRVNGNIQNYSGRSTLSIWSEGDRPTPVGFMTLAFSRLAPLWMFFYVVTTHSGSTSKRILKNKTHRFLINSCSSSWRCWVKCREKHHEKASGPLAWLA